MLENERWPVAIAKLAALADAPHALILDSDFASGVIHRQALYGITEEFNQQYMRDYASIDPRIPMALGNNRLAWLSDHDLFTEEFRKKDRFYREYIYANGGGETLITTFAKEGSRLGTAALIRTSPQEKLGDATRQRIDSVMLHLDRAVKLSRRFAAIASEAILGHTVLDALHEPLACAKSNGHLHRANLAFEETLRSGHIVPNKQGALQVRDPALQTQFLLAVRECCQIAEGGSSGDPDAQFTLRIDQPLELAALREPELSMPLRTHLFAPES